MAETEGLPFRGPPSIPEGQGSALFKKLEPSVSVTFDFGAFRAVWEDLERRYAERRHQAALTHTEALRRAVESLRNAYYHQIEPPTEERGTKVVRRKKPPAETVKKKRKARR